MFYQLSLNEAYKHESFTTFCKIYALLVKKEAMGEVMAQH
jgi:hypothetical protein